VDATLVLSGSWELFADAVLDVDWLLGGPADVVVVHRDDAWPPAPGFTNATVRLSCTDAYYCGGACDARARDADAAWPGVDWRGARAGGQAPRVRGPLYAADPEPVLRGYAALAPRREVRAAAAAWAAPAGAVAGHHQRLETTVAAEPVAKMCVAAAAHLARTYYAANTPGAAYYGRVCAGALDAGALAAAAAADGAAPAALLLASDRFNRSTYARWRADPRVARRAASPPPRARRDGRPRFFS